MKICLPEEKLNTFIHAKVSQKLRDDVEKLARGERRGLSDFVRIKLEDLVASHEKGRKDK